MRAFLQESLQLFYYLYFKPSALQARLNKAAPYTEHDTTFFRISWNIWRLASARRFLFQCLVWWLLGLLPFWGLAWGAVTWEGVLLVSASLLLAAWIIALLDLPLGLAFPLIAGLVWGLKPELCSELQARIAPWLEGRTVGWLAVGLLLSVALGGGAAGARTLGHSRLASWLSGLATFVAGGAAGVLAGGAVGVVVFVVAFVVASYVASTVAEEDETGGVASFVAFVVAFVAVVAGVVMFVVAFVVAGGVAGGVAGVVVLGVASYVAFKMSGGVAVGMTFGLMLVVALAVSLVVAFVVVGGVAGYIAIVVALIVSGVATLPLLLVLGFALGLGLVFSPRRSLWPGLVLASIAAAPFIEPRGWEVTGLALLSFLAGYFRLPLYPVALLSGAVAARWPSFHLDGILDKVVAGK